MKQLNNFGILAAVSWNTNNWEDEASQEDIQNSNFRNVQQYSHGHEDLNFAHKKLPPEKDNSFIAYTPMFNRLPSYETVKGVKVVFFKSNDWHTNINYIVGMYAFPEIDSEIKREGGHRLFDTYDFGNVKSKVDNIVRFENYIPISNERLAIDKFLPTGKKLGNMGFNYLHSDNVLRILDRARALNPNQPDLLLVSSRIKKLIVF